MKQKTTVQKIFPKPIRKLFRTMNFHFSEHGRVINRFAKTLPPDQRKQVVEQGKQFCVARSKKNVPRGFRNVAASLAIGQGMWYLGCPLLSEIPGIRDSALGWFAWGGSDKLFIASDQIFFTTDMVGGYSSNFAAQLAAAAPKTLAVGAATLAVELGTDFSRCWIEYWTQKKYGIVADGAARLYGQSRPFPVRYSSFEAYQKIISYIIRPSTIGTANQIFSSVQGFMGSFWRTGPQLGLVVTLGRAIDRFFSAISHFSGLRKLCNRIKNNAQEKENQNMQEIEKIVDPEKFLALKYMLGADSRKTWKWNPFKPALSYSDAVKLSKLASEYKKMNDPASSAEEPAKSSEKTLRHICEVENLLGKKNLQKIPEYRELNSTTDEAQLCPLFGKLLDALGKEREMI
jgi:hypothetical protein